MEALRKPLEQWEKVEAIKAIFGWNIYTNSETDGLGHIHDEFFDDEGVPIHDEFFDDEGVPMRQWRGRMAEVAQASTLIEIVGLYGKYQLAEGRRLAEYEIRTAFSLVRNITNGEEK